MKRWEVKPGAKGFVNGSQDLGIYPELRELIGRLVTVNRLTKKGFVEIEVYGDGRFYVPPRNIDLIYTDFA